MLDSDLTLLSGISYDVLRELAARADKSGAKLTITTSISHELVSELSAKYGKTIALIDGLNDFKKDKGLSTDHSFRSTTLYDEKINKKSEV